jgi:hypothetical protein
MTDTPQNISQHQQDGSNTSPRGGEAFQTAGEILGDGKEPGNSGHESCTPCVDDANRVDDTDDDDDADDDDVDVERPCITKFSTDGKAPADRAPAVDNHLSSGVTQRGTKRKAEGERDEHVSELRTNRDRLLANFQISA